MKLRKKSDELSDIVLKFINGQMILDNLLSSKKSVFAQGDIVYKSNLKQGYCKYYFVKGTSNNDQNTCHYYNGNGHMSYRCPVKRNTYCRIKCIRVPKGTIANIKGPKKL